MEIQIRKLPWPQISFDDDSYPDIRAAGRRRDSTVQKAADETYLYRFVQWILCRLDGIPWVEESALVLQQLFHAVVLLICWFNATYSFNLQNSSTYGN